LEATQTNAEHYLWLYRLGTPDAAASSLHTVIAQPHTG